MPHATIVYNLFHVVAKYSREVVNPVRVDETNWLVPLSGRNDMATRTRRCVIRGTRWLLLKNRANVMKHAHRVRLRELLAADRALFVVYMLKDDLKRLWRYKYPAAAGRFWHG